MFPNFMKYAMVRILQKSNEQAHHRCRSNLCSANHCRRVSASLALYPIKARVMLHLSANQFTDPSAYGDLSCPIASDAKQSALGRNLNPLRGNERLGLLQALQRVDLLHCHDHYKDHYNT